MLPLKWNIRKVFVEIINRKDLKIKISKKFHLKDNRLSLIFNGHRPQPIHPDEWN